MRAGLGRRRAALLGGAAAVLLGGWFTATAVIADHGWYDTRPSQVPWLPIAAAGFLGTLLVLARIPGVARALTAPGMASRLVLPHTFRVTGVFFLLYLALGHLPALFALPAGLGGIAAGITAPLVALRLAQGTGRRAAVWFNVYGLTDLAAGITLGALTGYGLLQVTPSTTPISQLPLALVIAADVPLMIGLHIVPGHDRPSLTTSAVSRRPAHLRRYAARCFGSTPGISRPVNVLKAAEKTMQLEIDALKEAAPVRAAARVRPVIQRLRPRVIGLVSGLERSCLHNLILCCPGSFVGPGCLCCRCGA